MANPTLMQKENGRYLWFALLGLGFQPDIHTSAVAGKTNVNVKHINLGANMFDKPNKDAFHIVIHFLLEKLSPTRFHEAYRYCWPVLNHKADAEFRKITCIWLREIMDEAGNTGSKAVASLFLSPGGPKFTSLMLNLAIHVMHQKMKTFTTDGSWVPEAAAIPACTSDMAVKRLSLIHKRFLKAAQDQDRFLQEYQRRAQHLVNSMRDINAEGAKYDELLANLDAGSAEDDAATAEKARKVRSLWSAIEDMLSTIKDGRCSVESVLKGDVDQFVLDGTDRVLTIPRCLLQRIEQLPHQLSSGKVYEDGQLNILSVMELMNHSLQLLREERRRASRGPNPQPSSRLLQEKCDQMARALQNLNLLREKVSKEEVPEVRSAIRKLEAEWDKKWMDTLKDTPLVSFLNEDPVLGFLSPMAPLSFEPAACHKSSIFSKYPAKLLEEKPAERRKSQEDVHLIYSNLKTPCPATVERAESPVVTEALRANTSLDWLLDTPPSPPQKASPAPALEASVRKTTHQKVAAVKTKTQILDMEYENLAEQFAEAVTTTSPSEGREKGLDLEGLLCTLQRDPFSARKQLPRTPESLIKDVKSSWRKAVQEDEAKKHQRAEFNSSVTRRLSPLNESYNVLPSPDAPSQTTTPPVTSLSSPPASQQGGLPKSTLLWDTFNMEALDDSSGTGSSAVQFNLNQETLPELSSCDSLLSLDDEAADVKSEDEELLLPSLKMEVSQTPISTRRHLAEIQQAYNDGSFMGDVRTPECLLSDYSVSGLDRDYTRSMETTDKVFSLDLDALETQFPQKKQEYSLPPLISFSPIDDMKC
ncbi:HAUS augmin-like complex subunit 6 [Mugil cephalus]|uniref:HAUS augmin-like complex subunit 6 n=1 Tax=Mugil cephalus TaxID=48193 RepID=UPI001FB8533A|nr:HAUS augmin-like complex subunit 6 [Mugil cephalus]